MMAQTNNLQEIVQFFTIDSRSYTRPSTAGRGAPARASGASGQGRRGKQGKQGKGALTTLPGQSARTDAAAAVDKAQFERF